MTFTITFDLSSELNNLNELIQILLNLPHFNFPTQFKITTSLNSNYTITLLHLTTYQLTIFNQLYNNS